MNQHFQFLKTSNFIWNSRNFIMMIVLSGLWFRIQLKFIKYRLYFICSIEEYNSVEKFQKCFKIHVKFHEHEEFKKQCRRFFYFRCKTIYIVSPIFYVKRFLFKSIGMANYTHVWWIVAIVKYGKDFFVLFAFEIYVIQLLCINMSKKIIKKLTWVLSIRLML